jgi:transaldolase
MRCHIITAPAAVLKKLPSLGTKTAADLSLDAVKAFREDAVSAGLTLTVAAERAAEYDLMLAQSFAHDVEATRSRRG